MIELLCTQGNMNIQIQKLCDKYHLSPKDRYEISQIYALLPDHKKQNLINNFANMAQKLFQIEEEIRIEREILIGNEVENIKNKILLKRKENMKNDIQQLKNEI